MQSEVRSRKGLVRMQSGVFNDQLLTTNNKLKTRSKHLK